MEKKTGRPTFLITGYPKTTLIFLDMLIVIHCLYVKAIIFLCVLWGFVKLFEWGNNFLIQQCKNSLFIPFVLDAIFFFRQALAGIFFQNHPPIHTPQKLKAWSAPMRASMKVVRKRTHNKEVWHRFHNHCSHIFNYLR